MLCFAVNLLFRRTVQSAVCWVIVLQFPIPLLHSHGLDLSFDGSRTAHVQRHHEDGDADLGHWHWHCVLPWELGQEEKEPEDRDRLPILCAGSPESVAVIDLELETIDIAVLPQLVLPFRVRSSSRESILSSAIRNVGFMHSFMNVPLCALIGVSLR